MQPKQVKIVSNKLDMFTTKYMNAQLSISGQIKIQGLLKKDILKVTTHEKFVTYDKIVILEKIPNSIKVFNSRFFDNIKDPCIDKVEISRSVMHVYNDKKKILM